MNKKRLSYHSLKVLGQVTRLCDGRLNKCISHVIQNISSGILSGFHHLLKGLHNILLAQLTNFLGFRKYLLLTTKNLPLNISIQHRT